ncbi:MAG: oligopeptide ABC transporter ATP-binding protein OppF, partial [Candidatus Omnitrophica bacterium]|nr:oligopeptide ABC transporter ATP-binding protein OppF [Candidatus Omnitrophota bacterium]
PYTQALLSAALSFKEKGGHLSLKGEVASAINPPSGCRFRTRCPHVMEICSRYEPALKDIASGHSVACHLIK